MAASTDRRASWSIYLLGGCLVLICVISLGMRRGGERQDAAGLRSVSEDAAKKNQSPKRADDGAARRHAVHIRRPAGPPVIVLQQPDAAGRVGRVACTVCHSVRPPNRNNRSPADLDEFHQGMRFEHGKLVCYSCHNPADADQLQFADGRAVAYQDVMQLCAQCHGPQARDYARYSHGGMNGYWDLTRGGRTRDNCIDCHDPHVPHFPRMLPTFKPRDRFLKVHPRSAEEDAPGLRGKSHE